MSLLFADGHCHSNPVRGLGAARIAEKFRGAGGWFIALVSLSPWHYGVEARSLEDYLKAIEVHVRECSEARARGLRVACIAGMHPADVDHLVSNGWKLERVLETGFKLMEELGRLCREGRLDGIGEVGRQHYKTSPERVAVAEAIMAKALEVARDYDCRVVHLHLENAGAATPLTVAKLVELGVRAPELRRVVVHHAKPSVAGVSLKLGFSTTLPGKEPVLRAAVDLLSSAPEGLMVESDFIDDPRRPCVSSCPWDVVEAERRLLAEGLVSEESLSRLNIDNIVRVYGVEPP